MAATERDFRLLFDTLNRLVESDPTHTPQILALLLAGGPFRPFLERPELMNRVLHMAKTFVADAQKEGELVKQSQATNVAKERAAPVNLAHHRRV